jgi:uncharacterized phosphosugar-binding protein
MLDGALVSTHAEREHDLARSILENHDVSPGDVAIVMSNSGRNAVPIEMALEMRARQAKVIAVTSLSHSQRVSSRHRSGKRLFEVADVVLDNGVPEGDALVSISGLDRRMGPGSTVAGAAVVNAVFVEAAAIASARGIQARVLRSANVDEGDRELEASIERYVNRIPALGRPTCS